MPVNLVRRKEVYRRNFIVGLIVYALLVVSSCNMPVFAGGGMVVSKDIAIKTANQEINRLGYIPSKMLVKATVHKTPHNQYIPEGADDIYYTARIKQLEDKEYWSVYYYPNPKNVGDGYKGGDICIFVDAISGAIITTIRGK